jgi:hypothetical protein
MSIAFIGISASLNTSVKNSCFYEVWRQNHSIRFAVSGILGNAIFYGLDKVLLPVIEHTAIRSSASNNRSICVGSRWINKNAASVSFFVAYLLDIAVQRKFLRACSKRSLFHFYFLVCHILIFELFYYYLYSVKIFLMLCWCLD